MPFPTLGVSMRQDAFKAGEKLPPQLGDEDDASTDGEIGAEVEEVSIPSPEAEVMVGDGAEEPKQASTTVPNDSLPEGSEAAFVEVATEPRDALPPQLLLECSDCQMNGPQSRQHAGAEPFHDDIDPPVNVDETAMEQDSAEPPLLQDLRAAADFGAEGEGGYVVSAVGTGRTEDEKGDGAEAQQGGVDPQKAAAEKLQHLVNSAARPLQAVLEQKPRCFDTWLQLICVVEQGNDKSLVMEIYQRFLSEFPLCWGYWKKLVKLRAAEVGMEKALQVYEEAVSVAGACVDLWTSYLDAAKECQVDDQTMRHLFERALGAVGLDWNGGCIWQKYLDFEEERADWERLGSLFARALATPTQALPCIHVRLRALVVGDACPPLALMCTPPERLVLAQISEPQIPLRLESAAAAGLQPPQEEAAPLPVPLTVPPPEESPDLQGQQTAEKDFLTLQKLDDEAMEDGEIGEDAEAGGGDHDEEEEPPAKVVKLSPQPLEEQEQAQEQEQEHQEQEQKQQQQQQQAPRAAGDHPLMSHMRRPPTVTGLPSQQPALRLRAVDPFMPMPPPPGGFLRLPSQKRELAPPQQWFLKHREASYRKSMDEILRRKPFEHRLRRDYFHCKPLSDDELEAWREYLDAEESQEPRDEARLCCIFERCLIVANNYLEFWLRYAAMWEDAGKLERARALLEYGWESGRLRGRPDALVAWSELEEHCRRPAVAKKLLDQALEFSLAGAKRIDLTLRRVALEMRVEGPAQAEQCLKKHLLAVAQPDIERFDEQLPTDLLILVQHYLWLCDDVLKDQCLSCSMLQCLWKRRCCRPHLVVDYVGHTVTHGCATPSEAVGPVSQLHGCVKTSMASRGCALYEEALQACGDDVELLRSTMSSYMDFLLSSGAPIDIFRSVQRRVRKMKIEDARRAGAGRQQQ
mmetsp:Transcript_72763/g.173385  ORF Transcript_72763/g.173385 Transcript_72763/m.173385 type:complete len:917 (+) Transcript_72763:84-2834(+)